MIRDGPEVGIGGGEETGEMGVGRQVSGRFLRGFRRFFGEFFGEFLRSFCDARARIMYGGYDGS
jgi:hypothetical protein